MTISAAAASTQTRHNVAALHESVPQARLEVTSNQIFPTSAIHGNIITEEPKAVLARSKETNASKPTTTPPPG